MSNVENQVRESVSRFLAGEMAVHDFWDWLSATAWDIDGLKDPEAAKIVFDAMTLMSEFQHGHRSEESLKAELARHVSYEPVMAQQPNNLP